MTERPVRPASRLGWWAFWLSAAAVAWGVLLPSLPRLASAMARSAGGPQIRIPVGFTSALLEFVLAVSALVVGGLALRKGERSWLVLLAFVPAVVVGGFWILFAVGEVLFPH